jgi:hypothetical protein
LGDYTARFAVEDPLHAKLPHPDTSVWLVEVEEGSEGVWARRYGVVVLDWFTGLLVHASYSEALQFLQSVPQIPLPGPVYLLAMGDDWNDYDELAAGIVWERPSIVTIETDQLEDVEAFVVERSDTRDGSWEILAVINSAGWDVTIQRPIEPDWQTAGRVSLRRGDEIWFWDWDVIDGQQYYYRVYGCTWLGRQTGYSNVVSAVAADPVPETPYSPERPKRGTFSSPCGD